MTTTDKEKPGGKPRQRSQKVPQRGQKPQPQQSPKLDPRDDRISQMVASTDAPASTDAATNGAVAPANGPLVSATAPVDAPSIGAVAPVDAPSIGAIASADDYPVSIQTIASVYVDYTSKSLQDGRSFVEKLMGVRSFDNAVEVQAEFARQALANFVAESQKICELYGKLASQILRPWESLAVKVAQAGR
jgi:Phasin protein